MVVLVEQPEDARRAPADGARAALLVLDPLENFGLMADPAAEPE
jgi:hypothetical protein